MLTQWSRLARLIRVPMGFFFAAFFLWRAQPSAASLWWSLLLVVPGLLLRAYAAARADLGGARLVIGGAKGWFYEEIFQVASKIYSARLAEFAEDFHRFCQVRYLATLDHEELSVRRDDAPAPGLAFDPGQGW